MRPEIPGDPAPPLADEPGAADESAPPLRSLLADVEALIDDARTWMDAEIGYQKSRAAYVAGRIKLLAGLAVGIVFLLFMALFGLTVGLIIALTPLITGWGATGVVVGLWLLGAGLMARKAMRTWQAMRAALDEKGGDGDG